MKSIHLADAMTVDMTAVTPHHKVLFEQYAVMAL
jgi:hypothetical protein